MRTIPITTALLIGFLAAAKEPSTQPAILAQATGEWVIDSSTGKRGAGDAFAEMIGTFVSISDGRISWIENSGEDFSGKKLWVRVSRRLSPRPDVSPIAIDIVADDPRYKAWSRVAIMKVVGGELHLCANAPQGPRPNAFEKGEDGREFVVLRRVKPAGE